MAKKIQDGNQIVTNVDSNDNLTFSIKDSFIDSTPTVNSTNLVTSGGVKFALDTNYYLKTEVYNKTEIDTLVGDIETLLANI